MPPRGRLAAAAPLIDAACLCVFVLIGRENHGIDEGLGTFFTIVWPFIAGWFAAALAVGVYTSGSRPWPRLAATVVIGVATAVLLRVTVTHRDAPPAFIIVAYGFILLTAAGWRVVALTLARLERRRRPQ